MNHPAPLRIGYLLRFAFFLTLAAAAAHVQGEEGGAPKAPSLVSRWLPKQLLLGPHIGCTASRFAVSKDYSSLIKPTPAAEDARFSAGYGALITARWRSGFSLAFAPRFESYRVDTKEETVSFANNPFPHTLKASTELSYTLWPLLLGFGWFSPHQHAQLQAGPYGAFLDEYSTDWTVDDQPYADRPIPQTRDTQTGWILAAEYGHRMGPGELLLGVEAQRENHSFLGGLKGSAKAESARISAAYAWFLMNR